MLPHLGFPGREATTSRSRSRRGSGLSPRCGWELTVSLVASHIRFFPPWGLKEIKVLGVGAEGVRWGWG